MKKTGAIFFFACVTAAFFSACPAVAAEVHEAAKNGDIAKLRSLLDKDHLLLYVRDEEGKTPLHWATGRGQLEAMRLLLDVYHVEVNVRNQNGGTALHVAASQAQPDAARLLLEHGAEVNARTKNAATPLHFASFKGKKRGHIEVARILLENNADPNARMQNGATPLSMALYNNNAEIANLLREFGAQDMPAKGLGRLPVQGSWADDNY